jgi:tetratricopeptide (TPR) repeat protein
VVERFASRVPTVGGCFIQMEDELAASIALQGAVWGGAKAFTVTSGPGFSLMMEHIGYAAMTETPCVFVDVQRGGPSTGLPTLPAQADMMQARWGSHGDYQVIALCPNSPQECFDLTIRAFNLAEHLGRPQDALPYAQRAFTVGGRAVAVADTLGWVYHLLGDSDQAIALLGPAASTRGAGADVLLHAARAFQAAGRPEPARAYLDRALQVQPSLESRSDVQALKAALK